MAKLTPKQVLDLAKEKKATYVDLKFMDFVGIWQHFSIPLVRAHRGRLRGRASGSTARRSAAGRRSTPPTCSSMPDPDTARRSIRSWRSRRSRSSATSSTRSRRSRTPATRATSRIKAEKYLKSTGIGDTAFFGPEPEFFIFDEVRYDHRREPRLLQGRLRRGPVEHRPRGGRRRTSATSPATRRATSRSPPTDSQQDIRTEMCRVMESVGIHVERQHHEVATAGQAEIDIRFDAARRRWPTSSMWFKYIIKNVARRHGKTVTFMPKPLYGDNGSGMHVHQSIWKGGKPLFAGDGYAGLSELAMRYIGGILKHAPGARRALLTRRPTVQAARAGLRGADQPRVLAAQPLGRRSASRCTRRRRRRSASSSASRIRRCNGYLAFAAMLMAGLDGIENKINPGQPLDKDIYALRPRS